MQDNQAGISAIEWTVYGKIKKVVKSSGMEITYGYDASGNRISKSVKGASNTVNHTWYVRDASGNVMSTYNSTGTAESVPSQLIQTDVHLYGSSRLGVMNLYRDAKRPYTEAEDISSERGRKLFEISNHLGNVLATVSDKKIAHSTDGTTVDYFDADLVTASDYYPFGMLLPGRQLGQDVNIPGGTSSGSSTVNGYTLPVDLTVTSRSGSLPAEYVAAGNVAFDGEFESMEDDEFTAYIADESYAGTGNMGSGLSATGGLYKYGFNGKENDNEVKGTGNQVDFGERAYDSRIGRWISIDKVIKAPFSSYQYSRNNPVNYIDPDGNDEIHFYYTTQQWLDKNGKSFTTVTWSARVIENGSKAHTFFIHNAGIGNFDNGGNGTEVFPFETGTNLPRTTSFAAAENSLPFATQVRSYLWGFGKSYTNDYEFLGRLLQVSPELKEYYKNDQQTTWSFANAEKVAGTAEFATKLLGVSETAFAIVDGYYAVKGLIRLATGIGFSGIKNMKAFMTSATKESKNGLTVVGRALQKHAGRKGSSFADIKFSEKTGNQQGLDVMNEILNSKNQLIDDVGNGTKTIFDKTTGRGVNVSRNGEFNGFRDIKELNK